MSGQPQVPTVPVTDMTATTTLREYTIPASSQEDFKTPTKPAKRVLSDSGSTLGSGCAAKRRSITIPPSPFLQKLGYGTGVSVFLMNRSNTPTGMHKSPWAVKKLNKKVNIADTSTCNMLEERLLHEAEILKSIQHENIVGYRDTVRYGKSGGGVAVYVNNKFETGVTDVNLEGSDSLLMEDLVFFLVFLSLTIFTFGVICQSILYPQSPLGWALVNDVLYKPYFQMYGELFLEEFDGGYKWILLGFYMILTNVLLLNLLIAMFSYTFQKVQDKSEVLWRYNYYDVVYEHSDKRFIPLLGTLVQIIKEIKRLKDEKNLRRIYCCRCCETDKHDEHPGENNFCLRFNEGKDKRITNFVKACMEKYVSQLAKLKSEDMSHKVTHTSKRLELVIESQGNLKSQLDQMNELMRTFLQQQISSVKAQGKLRESL